MYDYEFNTEKYVFSISQNGKIVFQQKLKNISNKVTIFKNISAIITEMIIYKNNGNVVNINVQDENKEFINASINSPIIAIDKYDIPLNLSSSYRNSHTENNNRYIFTNWEREYFYPEKALILTNKVLNQDDTIYIYGIKKQAKYDLAKIYDIPNDNVNSIDLFTKNYDYIPASEIIFMDKIQNTIYLTEDQINKYQMIVIDYLKSDSYCINFHYSENVYEVDIASISKDNKILYNTSIIDAENSITQINDYKITNINGNVNGYIVLQKGGN